MSDLGVVAASSARGSLVLAFGRGLSLVLSAVGVIFVARMLSPSEYGLYSLSFVLPRAFMLFNDFGVNQALVRFLSKYRSEERLEEALGLGGSGVLFKLMLGAGLSVLLFLSAGFLVSAVQGRPEVTGYVRFASLLVFGQTLRSAGLSVLTGLERMEGRAAMDILQGLVKGVLSPILVYLGYGVLGAVMGGVLSSLASATLGVFLMLHHSGDLDGVERVNCSASDLRVLLGYGIPLFLGVFVSGLVARFRGLLLSWYIAAAAVGNYGVASRFTSLVGVVTGSIGATLLPAFSRYSYDKGGRESLREAYRGSVRYTSIFVVPMTLLLMAAAEPAVDLLFAGRYPQAPLLMQLLLFPMLAVGLGSLPVGGFLNSQGETGVTMKIRVANSIILAILSPPMVLLHGITGFVASLTVSRLIGAAMGLYILNRIYDVTPQHNHSMRVYAASLLAALPTYLIANNTIKAAPLPTLIISSVSFLTVYMAAAPLLGALEERDLENLDKMLKHPQLLRPLIDLTLNIERKILELKNR